jgi:hypothetical protein
VKTENISVCVTVNFKGVISDIAVINCSSGCVHKVSNPIHPIHTPSISHAPLHVTIIK